MKLLNQKYVQMGSAKRYALGLLMSVASVFTPNVSLEAQPKTSDSQNFEYGITTLPSPLSSLGGWADTYFRTGRADPLASSSGATRRGLWNNRNEEQIIDEPACSTDTYKRESSGVEGIVTCDPVQQIGDRLGEQAIQDALNRNNVKDYTAKDLIDMGRAVIVDEKGDEIKGAAIAKVKVITETDRVIIRIPKSNNLGNFGVSYSEFHHQGKNKAGVIDLGDASIDLKKSLPYGDLMPPQYGDDITRTYVFNFGTNPFGLFGFKPFEKEWILNGQVGYMYYNRELADAKNPDTLSGTESSNQGGSRNFTENGKTFEKMKVGLLSLGLDGRYHMLPFKLGELSYGARVDVAALSIKTTSKGFGTQPATQGLNNNLLLAFLISEEEKKSEQKNKNRAFDGFAENYMAYVNSRTGLWESMRISAFYSALAMSEDDLRKKFTGMDLSVMNPGKNQLPGVYKVLDLQMRYAFTYDISTDVADDKTNSRKTRATELGINFKGINNLDIFGTASRIANPSEPTKERYSGGIRYKDTNWSFEGSVYKEDTKDGRLPGKGFEIKANRRF